jgi:hypothetical protein
MRGGRKKSWRKVGITKEKFVVHKLGLDGKENS